MAQFIVDPGFELFPLDGVDGWLGSADPAPAIVTDPVQAGLKSCRLRWQSVFGTNGGVIVSKTLGAGAVGVSPVTFWARRSGSSHGATVLRTTLNRAPDNVSIQMDLNFNSELSETFQQFDMGAGALKSTDFVQQFLRNSAPVLASATAYVDSFDLSVVDSDMAVLLAELPRKALLKQLQDNLGPELTKIIAERADSLGLPAPKAWFAYERRPQEFARKIDEVSVEVFTPPIGVGFPLWAQQVQGFTAGLASPPSLQSSVVVDVILYHVSRGNLNGAQMRDRSDRYAAAIMRVIRNDATLGQSGIIVRMPESEAIVIGPTEKLKTSGVLPDQADSVRVRVIAQIQETSDGEGDASGGVAPVPPLGTEVF